MTVPIVNPLMLPVKIHLENPLLGKNCYVGSNANPIVINMTIGAMHPPPPNPPLHGHYGTLEFNEAVGEPGKTGQRRRWRWQKLARKVAALDKSMLRTALGTMSYMSA